MRTAVNTRRVAAAIRWYLREVSGEADYDRYVAHEHQEHPGVPPLSRRDFERRKNQRRQESPEAGCC
jgi:uncharacterized short protein YbdD (DUF466 family)